MVAEAGVAVVVGSGTAETINIISIISNGRIHSTPRIVISSNGLHSPPRSMNISSCSNINSSISCSSILSSNGRQDSTMAGGDHRVVDSVASTPDTSMQSLE